ncbi:ATP-binding protein [Piscinibacter sp. HJYY11]|uniref:sensor histidine kinase n=1 Tax=Piscinibacter sp. HJYY11 TaxID=2801333 RepID=UPI00191E8156|nr:sensor histidine kinase [Piscinibacter sp. HJYY11]MBL0726462.1 sensor histidine kinase [Piscinibacter sp. HJYY11]
MCEVQTEDLRDTVRRLRSFNHGVSHDLRGPLGALSGITRLAMHAIERSDTARAMQLLSTTALQTDALCGLVMALLAVAEGDRLPEERLDLREVVVEAIEHLALVGTAPLPHIRVAPLFFVRGSRVLLRQVFVNLLGNALKFTRERAVPVVEVDLGAPGTVVVRDNGIGFDASAACGLFEPFQRLHDAAHPGMGIGLSLVKRIVERHGGRVWAESAPGQGACFHFTLPAAE